jgi:hypothetical protein
MLLLLLAWPVGPSLAPRRPSPAPGRSLEATLARLAGDKLSPALAGLLGG